MNKQEYLQKLREAAEKYAKDYWIDDQVSLQDTFEEIFRDGAEWAVREYFQTQDELDSENELHE